MVAFGALWSYPVLSADMARDLLVSRTTLQGAFSLHLLGVAACAPLIGRAMGRFGARALISLGVLGLGIALVVIGLAPAPWMTYVGLAAAAPAAAAIEIGVVVAVGISHETGRGRAFGTVGVGIGVGLALLPPAAVVLADVTGWRETFLAMAAVATVTGAASTRLLARNPASAEHDVRHRTQLLPHLRSSAFLLLFAGGIGIGFFDEAVYQHLVPYLRTRGVAVGLAAATLAVVSGGYLAGQFLGGAASDRWGRWPTGAAAAGSAAGGIGGLVAIDPGRPIGLQLASLVFGLGLGATLSIRRATLVDLFIGPVLPGVVGAYQWSYAIGAAAAAWGGAAMYEALGSYVPTLLAAAAATAVWATSFYLALRLRTQTR